MSKGINIFSTEWLNMVFEGKNKDYGAYQLRSKSEKRHRVSMYIAFSAFTLAVCAPMLVKAILPEKGKERNLEVTTLVDLNIPEQPKEDEIKEVYVPPPPVRSELKFTAPVIKPDEEVPIEEEMKTQDELNETTIVIGAQDIQGVDTLPPDITDLENEVQQQIVEVEVVSFATVEEQPLFPGGDEALLEFIRKNTTYPQEAIDAQVSGRVFVGFVIDQRGKVTNVKLLRGVSQALDNEAMRVVKSMPDWTPGRQNGRPVRVSYQVPVNFTLR
ncbi:MAG: TonB family protein [Bacteroidales bacterium]|nr:TonB family protein [Bacteroidales bacterium]